MHLIHLIIILLIILLSLVPAKSNFSPQIIQQSYNQTDSTPPYHAFTDHNGVKYSYMGNFDPIYGKPNYLIQNKGFDVKILKNIRKALRDQRSVPAHAPQYLSEQSTSIELSKEAEVWVDFLLEGAGYTNALAYYTYETDNPPATVQELKNITIIFPNASIYYGGGSLRSGDRVFLGSFPANTTIGWVILTDAWKSGTTQKGINTFYSNTAWNPESQAKNRQHNVTLLDPQTQILVVGFEDLAREANHGDRFETDNDFEDMIFAVKVSPFAAVANREHFAFLTQTVDNEAADHSRLEESNYGESSSHRD